MRRAFSDVFAAPAQAIGTASPVALDVPMAGRTDRWIFDEMASRYAVTLDAATRARLHVSYLTHLAHEIERPAVDKAVLPGVRPLLDALVQRSDVTLGLLTGNLAAGARVKLEYFDLWNYFVAGGFGDDASDRTHLFDAAIRAVAEQTGRYFTAGETVIVGDTPHDVAVARASGARCLAVATGGFGPDALTAAGAELVLQDLTDLGRAFAALGLAMPLA